MIGVGVLLMRSHVRSWAAKKNDSSLDERERRHLHSRFRRRMQASAILAALGVLIPLGGIVIPWQQFPGFFAPYWIAVLLLALWVILLGMADVVATSAHTRAELTQLPQPKPIFTFCQGFSARFQTQVVWRWSAVAWSVM